MLARIRKSMEEKDQGFTLIELLVVMIIIGILAAIAIPVFLNQRAKARDTATKADVSTIGKEVATYFVDGTGTLTASQTAVGDDVVLTDGTYSVDVKVSEGSLLGTEVITNDTTWCIPLSNSKGDVQAFQYSAKNGLAPGTCAAGTF